MGIIKAAAGSIGGVMADQWLEAYSCDSLPEGVLAMRAQKKLSERSSNTKGEENVISDGSAIIVNAGQCALAIDKGQVTGVYDTPGVNIYHSDRSASIFHKGGLKGVLKQSFDRFSYGGIAAVYQIIMFIDVREHMGNPFSLDMPINLTDRNTGLSFDAALTVGGMYSFCIEKPEIFYKKVCGNSTGMVFIKDIMPQISAEFCMLLRQAVAAMCQEGTTAYDIGMHADRIAEQAAAQVNETWIEQRGFAISSIGIDTLMLKDKDKNLLQSVQMAKALTDPKLAAATLTGAAAQAMQSAALNPGRREPIKVTFSRQ